MVSTIKPSPLASKVAHALILRTCEYAALHGQSDYRCDQDYDFWDEDIILDYLGVMVQYIDTSP